MNVSFPRVALAAAAATGASLSALATTPAELEAQLAALQAEIAQIKSDQAANEWMTERRAAEVRSLVQEVLADEHSQAASGAAGHNGKNFILASEDGDFELKIAGQIQFRYLFNDADASGSESGFQTRRAKIKFSGKAYGFGYKLDLAHDRDGGAVETDGYEISYKFENGVKVKGGFFKLPFARQELISSSRQVAAERSITNEFFTLDKAEGVQVEGSAGDSLIWAVAFSDGGDTGVTEFTDDTVEYAFTGRVDGKLAGNWGQAKDAFAWNGEETAAFVGAAVHFEKQDESDDKTFALTVDGLVETGNFSVLGAYFYAQEDGSAAIANEQQGFYVQGAYNFDDTWVPFIRYNWLDQDVTGVDEVQAVTFGVNYLFDKHNAKFTLDCVYVFDGADGGTSVSGLDDGAFSDALGLVNPAGEDEVAVRAQMQLLF